MSRSRSASSHLRCVACLMGRLRSNRRTSATERSSARQPPRSMCQANERVSPRERADAPSRLYRTLLPLMELAPESRARLSTESAAPCGIAAALDAHRCGGAAAVARDFVTAGALRRRGRSRSASGCATASGEAQSESRRSCATCQLQIRRTGDRERQPIWRWNGAECSGTAAEVNVGGSGCSARSASRRHRLLPRKTQTRRDASEQAVHGHLACSQAGQAPAPAFASAACVAPFARAATTCASRGPAPQKRGRSAAPAMQRRLAQARRA